VITIVLLLAPLYALAGTLQPVKLRVHGREVALKTPAVYDGREVYLPLEALTAFKATYVVTRREETVIVTPAAGASVEIALARPGRELMFPLSALNKKLHLPMDIRDGVCDLDAPVRQPEQSAKRDPDRVSSQRVRNEERKEIPSAEAPSSVQVKSLTQTKATPAKVTSLDEPVQSAGSLDSPQSSQAAKSPIRPAADTTTPQSVDASSKHFVSAVKGELDDELQLNLPASTSREAKNPSANPQYQAPVPSVSVERVTFDPQDDKHAQLRIKTSGRAQIITRLLRAPTRLSIDFKQTGVTSEQREWTIEHPFLSAMHLVQGDEPGTTRLVLDLSELIGYNVEDPTPEGVTINLMVPRGVGKKLRGFPLVIDPGHGGPDSTGCSATVNGVRVYEKNITLDIAKRLHRLCTEAAMNAMMTRTTDADVGLDTRPAIANRNNAELFVSIHVDDCGIPNSASGTTAYYHMDDASSRALAHSIAEHVGNVSGLPVRGAWSDRRRFPNSGMAVLRGSRMPATLVEVAYINNSRDRAKLLDPEFRQTIAQAIFDGIKGYVHGDLPDAPVDDVGMH
jgi:N-acetylmuramoyl-L-alanine amidase